MYEEKQKTPDRPHTTQKHCTIDMAIKKVHREREREGEQQ